MQELVKASEPAMRVLSGYKPALATHKIMQHVFLSALHKHYRGKTEICTLADLDNGLWLFLFK